MRTILTSLAAASLIGLVVSNDAYAFAREFNQDNHPSAFQSETSAELCLFVRSRQGVLMIQPYCMVSSSSHSENHAQHARLDEDNNRAER